MLLVDVVIRYLHWPRIELHQCILFSFTTVLLTFIASLGRGASRCGRGTNLSKTWNTRGSRGVGRGNTASRGAWSNRGMSQSRGYNLGQSSGSYPQSSGSYPQSSGSYPQSSGSYPQSSGSYPQSSGSYPQSSAGPGGTSSYNYDSYNSSHDSYGNDSYGMTNNSYLDNSSYSGNSMQGSVILCYNISVEITSNLIG